MNRRFQLVDVFNDQPFSGNPLAVVFDADGLSTETMQAITRWLNLSETAFLLQPTVADADYRVRIFTLDRELPFAGHPTLGSCHAWLTAGGQPRRDEQILQECAAGSIPIQRHEGRLSFRAPPLLRSGPVDEAKRREVAQALRIDVSQIVDAQWADNGPGWLVVLLESAQAVLDLQPLRQHHGRLEIGVVGPHPAGHPIAFEIRTFFTDQHGGVMEDPVTGSLNASAAQWLFASGRARHSYLAAQGTRLGRTGRIYLKQDAAGAVWVGGKTQTLFSGNGAF